MVNSDPFIFATPNMKLAYSILKQKQFYSRVFFYSHLHSFWLGRKICPPPERVELGFIHGQQFWEGEKVLYSCEPGYWLIGSPERHCLKNGSWSGNQPSCIMPGNTYVYNLNRSFWTNKNQKKLTEESADKMWKSKHHNTHERSLTDDIRTVQLKLFIIRAAGIN